MHKFLFLFLFLISFNGFSQKDSLKLKNNDIIVGELKSMVNGIITMKTSYSDKDFRIEYLNVKELYLDQTFLINLINKSHYLGIAKTVEPGKIEIISEGMTFVTNIENIIQLQAIDNEFWSRFKGNIDLGFNLTKANNFNQFSLGSNLKYESEFWNFSVAYSSLFTNQDDVDDIKRVEWNIDAQRYIVNEWFAIMDVSFLSNTEQALKGRVNTLGAIGKYLITTNRLYLGVRAGVNYNVETYFDETLDKNSTEANIAADFNMFEFGDFNLTTGFTAYPSLSESGRFRLDYNLVLKYDLPWEFYIKFDFALNYDNQPAVIGNDFDYIFNSGFGWELK
mgnify:CR=1 FL=1